MAKKNTHNLALIKQGCSYSVPEIAALFCVHKATVLSWLKSGLKKIDKHKPFLIHSGDLRDFLKTKQQARKRPCKTNEFYCMKCRVPVKPKNRAVMLAYYGSLKFQICAKCETCNTKVFKAGSHKRMAQYQKFFVISTEVKQRLIGCESTSVKVHLQDNENDRNPRPKKRTDQMELFSSSKGRGGKG